MMEARGAFRLFMDADNSTTLDQVDRFWPYFEKGYDVVIGSRALKESVIGVRQARHKEIAGRSGTGLSGRSLFRIQDTQADSKCFPQKRPALSSAPDHPAVGIRHRIAGNRAHTRLPHP